MVRVDTARVGVTRVSGGAKVKKIRQGMAWYEAHGEHGTLHKHDHA